MDQSAGRGAETSAVATTTGTLRAFLDYWLSEIIEPNRAPAAFDNYERFVRLYIRPGLGERRLSRLSVRDVKSGSTKWRGRVNAVCRPG